MRAKGSDAKAVTAPVPPLEGHAVSAHPVLTAQRQDHGQHIPHYRCHVCSRFMYILDVWVCGEQCGPARPLALVLVSPASRFGSILLHSTIGVL